MGIAISAKEGTPAKDHTFPVLLGDLGLQSKRKGGGLREVYDPYGPEDFSTIVEKWIAKSRC